MGCYAGITDMFLTPPPELFIWDKVLLCIARAGLKVIILLPHLPKTPKIQACLTAQDWQFLLNAIDRTVKLNDKTVKNLAK